VNGDQYDEFEEMMTHAAVLSYRQKGVDWRELMNALWEELEQYDLEVLRAAVMAHVRSEKFFPALGDIITRIEGTAEDRAKLAWRLVVRAIERLGHYDSVRFPSPAHHYAIEQMGGWRGLCARLTNDELPFREKDFVRFFEIGERVASWGREEGKVHVPEYCVGAFEVNNRAIGYALPAVIDARTGKPVEGIRASLPAPADESVTIIRTLAEKMSAS
jgi:hypothetical protein